MDKVYFVFSHFLFAFPNDAVIRVYDAAGNVSETHEHTGDFDFTLFARFR